MTQFFSELLDRMCDSYSDEWRHECECRWLMTEKSDPIQLHLFLYGVENRSQVVVKDATGRERLLPDYSRLWKDPKSKPLCAYRSLQSADKLLSDVLKLKKSRVIARPRDGNKGMGQEISRNDSNFLDSTYFQGADRS